jgi:hypothetical protein
MPTSPLTCSSRTSLANTADLSCLRLLLRFLLLIRGARWIIGAAMFGMCCSATCSCLCGVDGVWEYRASSSHLRIQALKYQVLGHCRWIVLTLLAYYIINARLGMNMNSCTIYKISTATTIVGEAVQSRKGSPPASVLVYSAHGVSSQWLWGISAGSMCTVACCDGPRMNFLP